MGVSLIMEANLQGIWDTIIIFEPPEYDEDPRMQAFFEILAV